MEIPKFILSKLKTQNADFHEITPHQKALVKKFNHVLSPNYLNQTK